MTMKDYHEILGVPKNASEADIKQAYRKLASRYHPDKETGDTEKFKEIEEAYRNLTSNEPRQEHNYHSMNDQFDSIFRNFFNASTGRQNSHYVYTTVLFVTLEQLAKDEEVTINIRTQTENKIINIKIPPGIEDGNEYKYTGLLNGELRVTFRLYRHPKFEKRGLDLYMTEVINVIDLMLGTKLITQDIFGNTLELNIPEMTKPGTTFRIPSRGLSKPPASGDQYVLIQTAIPDKIDSELRVALETFRAKYKDKT